MRIKFALSLLSMIFFAAAFYVFDVGKYPPFLPPFFDLFAPIFGPGRVIKNTYVLWALAGGFFLAACGLVAGLWSIVKSKSSAERERPE